MHAPEEDRSAGGAPSSIGIRQHPVAALFVAILFGAAALEWNRLGLHSLLARNGLSTLMAAAVLWLAAIWVLPRWMPTVNAYLWTEAGSRVPVRHSVAVALVSFFVAFVAIFVLLFLGQRMHSDMTDHWDALWICLTIAAMLPLLIAIHVGLKQSGAMHRYGWLDLGRVMVDGSPPQFNDLGRIFVTIIAACIVAMIQGGIVLTGGLSISFFSFMLVSAGTVAALASDRPAYPIFTVTLCLWAAVATEWIGSYEPPSRSYYPVGHLTMFTLTVVVGLLIDLGRRGRRSRRLRSKKGVR